MNILYCGCHSVLEFDEVKLFTEMGHKVFSLGGIYQASNEGSLLRGSIPNLEIQQELNINPQTKEDINQQTLDWADIILMTHNVPSNNHPQPWLNNNWDKFKNVKKPVIWRSIGQSNKDTEKSLEKFRKDGLKIVRYSPKEESIPNYAGSDVTIRFYADPTSLDGYTGEVARIVTVAQALFGSKQSPSRGDHMNFKEFNQIVEGLEWKVFGPDNDFANEHNGGKLSYEDLKQMMRFNRLFLSLGTRPASYTLGFMDAWMLGMPVIAVGPKLGNSVYRDQATYEVHELIGENGKAGFWSDNIDELREFCKMLLEDPNLAKTVGSNGRLKAIQFFGKEGIKKQWKDFLSKL